VVIELPKEIEIYLEELKTSVKILVLDEPSEDWQVFMTFVRVFASRNDLALRVYSKILEVNGKVSTWNLTALLNEPRYSINKACADLEKLGLIEGETKFKGSMEFNYWRPKKKVLGILRLIPSQYFKNGKPLNLANERSRAKKS
jgi:predicted transcriptional regulator